MKKLLLSFVVITFTFMANAQSDPVNEVFSRYANQEGFTVVNISGDMFNMLKDLDKGDDDLQKLSGSVSDFKILVHEGKANADFPGFHELIYNKLDKGAYKELMTVKNHNQDVNFMVKQDGDYISELLMIVSGDDDVLMRLKGHFKMSDLAGIAGSMNIAGMENLKLAAE